MQDPVMAQVSGGWWADPYDRDAYYKGEYEDALFKREEITAALDERDALREQLAAVDGKAALAAEARKLIPEIDWTANEYPSMSAAAKAWCDRYDREEFIRGERKRA